MKRCTNCGYVNPKVAETCEKCETELKDGSSFFIINTEDDSQDGDSSLPTGLRMTIRDRSKGVSASYLDEEEEASPVSTPSQTVFTCPNCWHTPLRQLPSASSPCPNCGYVGSASQQREDKPAKSSRRQQTVMMQDLVIEDDGPASFRLINERSKDSMEFQGDGIVLNRGNLDPNNASLSGDQHATISRENGQWYLEDLSSNKATFIQVRGKIHLQPGDRIILGNKIFRFDPD